MRRAVVGLGLLLLLAAVVGLGTPSGAQAAPTMSAAPTCAPAGGPIDITITGQNFPQSSRGTVTLDSGGPQAVSQTWVTGSGVTTWSVVFKAFTPQQERPYTVSTSVSGLVVTTTFTAPCPRISLTPACGPTSTSSVTLAGAGFAAADSITITWDVRGSQAYTVTTRTDGSGHFSTTLKTPMDTNRDYAVHVNDTHGHGADATFTAPCPVVTTTTTTSPPVTTAPTTTTTQPVITVTTLAKTTTTRPATTTTTIPPPTPGATLVVMPAIGKPGSVVLAHGSGFPPGPVVLVWTIGIGTTTATAGSDGTFSTQVLVFPRDRLGPRALTATAGSTTASAAFLVVPDSVKPSGREVSQIISLSRRFLER